MSSPIYPPGALLPSRSAAASATVDCPHVGTSAGFQSPISCPPSASWLIAAGLLLASASPFAQSSASAAHQHAHVHGMAKLGVAVQDKTVVITLESPLDSLIGFEHRANTPAQKSQVEALQARMKAPQDLFRLDSGAACTLTKSEAQSAIFQPAPAAGASEEHADLDATLEYSCAHPERLTMLDVDLFRSFPRLKKLDVDVATGKGQFKRNLTSPQRTISLVR